MRRPESGVTAADSAAGIVDSVRAFDGSGVPSTNLPAQTEDRPSASQAQPARAVGLADCVDRGWSCACLLCCIGVVWPAIVVEQLLEEGAVVDERLALLLRAHVPVLL